ncbi:MAG TPA: hypothetical protein VFQ42_22385 [Mycobacterium sp.]|nr:hypothetical protein [Mycobacterium sp.]
MRTATAALDLTDTAAAHLRRAWLASVQRMRGANPPAELAGRLHRFDPLAGVDNAVRALAVGYAQQFVATGAAVAEDITHQLGGPQPVPIRKDQSDADVVHFDPIAPGVLNWAEQNRLDLIRDITAEQRIMIRYALSVAQETGENPLVTARTIQESIGLSETQLQWVANFERSLRAGQYAAAADRQLVDGRTARTLRAAAARDGTLSSEQIDAAVSRYRDAMVAYRAETIARTEAARIVGAGTTDAYEQAIASGDLQADQLICTWVHGRPRGKRQDREFHVSMNGQTRGWGEPFLSGKGRELLYPGDPDAPVDETANCGCARTVRVRPRSRMAA